MAEDLTSRQRILIVDDARENIHVLMEALKSDYELSIATSGPKALKFLKKNLPNLVLLDVMMPEMNGYEVCSRIKADERTRDIPVIFITAMDDIEGKIRGFDSGAVDYITKPFESQEVLIRVRSHLALRDYATKLEQMVQERTRQLVHADRLATLGTFAAAVVHEINNPVNYISGNAELLQLFWEHARPILERHASEDESGHTARFIPRVSEMLGAIVEGSLRINRMAGNLKSYSRDKEVQKSIYPVKDIVKYALSLLNHRLQKGVKTDISIPTHLKIWCDPQKISQVLVNLLGNSLDAMEDMPYGKKAVSIRAEPADRGMVLIRLKDSGPGIPDEAAERIFDPFFTTKPREHGTGLGLFIVNGLIEEHQGEIRLSPFDGSGAEFNIHLPVTGSQAAEKEA